MERKMREMEKSGGNRVGGREGVPSGTEHRVVSAAPATAQNTDASLHASTTASSTTSAAASASTEPAPLSDRSSFDSDSIIRWLTTDWLLKLGSLLILLGIGWFVSYAFAQNWIGPLGRISLGLGVGAVVMAVGYLRSRANTQQGTVFLVLGAAAVLITTYAAREVYDFFTPVSALGIMAAAAGFVALSSVQHQSLSRAMAGILIACVAPFLTVSAEPSVTGLFLYLFVVMSASVWIVLVTGWKEVLLLATAIYAGISILSLGNGIPDSEIITMQIMATAFVVLFYGIGLISAIRTKQVLLADVTIKVISAAIFLYWVHEIVPEHTQSLVAGAASLMSAMSAWMLMTGTKNKWLVLLHGSLALVYLAVAAAFELEAPANLYAYTALSVVAVWLAARITQDYSKAQWFGLPLGFVSLETLRQLATRPRPEYLTDFERRAMGAQMLEPLSTWGEILAAGIIADSLLFTAWYLYRASKNTADPDQAPAREAVIGFSWAGIFMSVVTIWVMFEKFFTSEDIAHGWALALYAIAGISIYVWGRLKARGAVMFTGGLVLAGVIMRLMLVEVWNMEVTARVIVFLFIGALLIAGAFIKPQIEGQQQ